MVYTRFKCDRYPFYLVKYLAQDYPMPVGLSVLVLGAYWKYFSWCSEETERKNAWWSGYPYWRDPIGKRMEAKYKSLIRDNNVDVTDPKWTGVARDQLHHH